MKVKPEHYAALEAALHEVAEKYPDGPAQYGAAGLSDERFRWDALWASRPDGMSGVLWVNQVIYPYAKDSHLDTALRKAVMAVWGRAPERKA